MIDLKMILSAVARTFGISSPEDLRKQKRVASKSDVPRVDSNNQQSTPVRASRRSIQLNRQRDNIVNHFPGYRGPEWSNLHE
jgi:hypothetical protein